MPLLDYQTLVDSLVRDRDQVITTDQRDAMIGAAVAEYSVGQPRRVVVDVVSAGGQRIDLPAGFTDSSQLLGIEYPVGNVPASELPLSDVTLYDSPTARLIELPVTTAANDTLRVSYTADHLVDATDDTVPVRHRQAVASLAASLLCGQLASYYASEGESSISADSVDYKDKSQRFRLRAKDLAADYTRVVGVPPSERNKGASVTVELERNTSLGYGRLFHPTRNWPR